MSGFQLSSGDCLIRIPIHEMSSYAERSLQHMSTKYCRNVNIMDDIDKPSFSTHNFLLHFSVSNNNVCNKLQLWCDRFVESRSHLLLDTAVRGGSGSFQFSEKSGKIKNFDGKPVFYNRQYSKSFT